MESARRWRYRHSLDDILDKGCQIYVPYLEYSSYRKTKTTPSQKSKQKKFEVFVYSPTLRKKNKYKNIKLKKILKS